MITTCGRRRSTSATAPAPSEASPITRTCGARESEPEALADDLVVVDDQAGDLFGHRREVYSGVGLHLQGKAVRGGGGRSGATRRSRTPCCRASSRTPLPDRIDLRAREIRPSHRDPRRLELLRPVARERLEEVLLRAGREVEQVRPDPHAPAAWAAFTTSASCSGRSEAGQDHADADACAHTRRRAPLPQALPGRRARFPSARPRGRASGRRR